ncbi:MAG: exodeoxyribonuclease III [Blastocatellia bacterium]|nr:exodeoxyribonuclease III [Blastocatellia bacterium]
MIIATWNINSITSRLDHVVRWSEKNRPDVLCLQETKCIDSKFPIQPLRDAGYRDFAFLGERAYNGVAVLSRYPLENVQLNFPDDKKTAAKRLIAVTVNGIRLVNVYIPHGTALGSEKFEQKLAWIARLRRLFDEEYDRSKRVVLCGDLNVAPHELDVWKPSAWKDKMHFTKTEREAIRGLKRWGFTDLFRHINDEQREYTWWDLFRPSSFEKDRGLRIDHIWASPSMTELCTDCWIDREPRAFDKPSDHAPVLAAFSI